MSVQIRFTPAAVRDLTGIAIYLGERSARADTKFLNAAEKSFALLSESPTLGEVLQFDNPRLKGIRVRRIRGFEKYLIFYRTTPKVAEIVRILHGARDIAAILDEE